MREDLRPVCPKGHRLSSLTLFAEVMRPEKVFTYWAVAAAVGRAAEGESDEQRW